MRPGRPVTDEDLDVLVYVAEHVERPVIMDSISFVQQMRALVAEIRHLRAENERLTAAMLLLQSPKVES